MGPNAQLRRKDIAVKKFLIFTTALTTLISGMARADISDETWISKAPLLTLTVLKIQPLAAGLTDMPPGPFRYKHEIFNGQGKSFRRKSACLIQLFSDSQTGLTIDIAKLQNLPLNKPRIQILNLGTDFLILASDKHYAIKFDSYFSGPDGRLGQLHCEHGTNDLNSFRWTVGEVRKVLENNARLDVDDGNGAPRKYPFTDQVIDPAFDLSNPEAEEAAEYELYGDFIEYKSRFELDPRLFLVPFSN